MKQKDIIVIVIVSVIAGIFGFIIANALFGGAKAYNLTAPRLSAVTSESNPPSTTYFNSSSINPTKDITIGDTSNSQPFNGSSQ